MIVCGNIAAEERTPSGMMMEFLCGSMVTGITDATPEFGWIVHSSSKNDVQSAYRILVSSELEKLDKDQADMWDSGKVDSDVSINVAYRGKELSPNQSYSWKVKTWTRKGGGSAWAQPQRFVTAKTLGTYSTPGYSVVKQDVAPSEFTKKGDGHYFVDFGRAAAGTVRLTLTSPSDGHVVTLHLGEKTATANSVDRKPGGSIRYQNILSDHAARYGKGHHIIPREQGDRQQMNGHMLLKPRFACFEKMVIHDVEQKNDCQRGAYVIHYSTLKQQLYTQELNPK